jgi:hypothetical protein
MLSRFQNRCRADVSVSVFRPRRLQYETATGLALRYYTPYDKSCFTGCHSCCVLAIVLLRVFDGHTTLLDLSIGNFGLLGTVRRLTR